MNATYGEILLDDWWRMVELHEHPSDASPVMRAGEGDATLLLLHGIGNSGGVFSPVMPSLAEIGPVVAPMVSPSLLAAPTGEPTSSMTPLVEWLAEVAPPPWRLVGHSMGGVLAGLILRSHPELVRGAVLLNSPLPSVLDRLGGRDTVDRTGRALLFMKLLSRFTAFGRPRLPRMLHGTEIAAVRNGLRGFVNSPSDLDRQVISRAILMSTTSDARDFFALAAQMPEWERRPFEDVPVRILLGEDDPLIPVDDLTSVDEMYPGADVTIIEECAHFAHLEQPARTVDEIIDFFASLD